MTFLQEIEAFLLELQADYSFIIPVDRMQTCLSCATDITDMEEVYYRLQSLVCENHEEMETFRSLFAQRLFKIQPKAPWGQGKSEWNVPSEGRYMQKQADLNDRVAIMQMRVNTAKSKIDSSAKREKELQEEKQTAERRISEIQESIAKENPKLGEKTKAATPDLDSPELKKQLSAAMKRLNTANSCLSGSGKDPNPENGLTPEKVKEALSSPNYASDLESMCSMLLQKSAKARSRKDMDAFRVALNAIADLKKLKETACNTIASKSKRAYDSVARELRKTRKDSEEAAQTLKRIESDIKNASNQSKNAELNYAAAQANLEKAQKEADAYREKAEAEQQAKAIKKPNAKSHRPIFENGVNAVQTTAEITKLMETDLRRMSNDEKQRILSYIRSASQAFRQTLRRKYGTNHKRQIDVKATIRAAVRTDGDPILVKYKKPHKSHAKVIILTDISGSCRNTSELALYFMAEMDEAFPGGCRKYAFVNHLVPADQYFRNCSADEGVKNLTESVKTRGVYSDYGTTIHQLREECGGTAHSDTTIIVIGDARNNRNESAADDLKYLADRCHKLYWLNTEDQSEWNCGDSIIGTYQAAGADVRHVSTSGELIQSLSSLSVRS